MSQEIQKKASVMNRQKDFWKRYLSGDLSDVAFPSDYVRPPVSSFLRRQENRQFGENLYAKLNAFSTAESISVPAVLLTAFNILIYRYTLQEIAVTGVAVEKPYTEKKEGVEFFGQFVNLLAIRIEFGDNLTIRKLLQRVEKNIRFASENRDYPIDNLIEELNNHPYETIPLFRHIVAIDSLVGINDKQATIDDLILAFDSHISQCDIAFLLQNVGGNLRIDVDFDEELFQASTIHRLLSQYEIVLDGVVQNPERLVSTLPLVTKKEGSLLLSTRSKISQTFQVGACIHERFEAQVERTPDAIALTFPDNSDARKDVHLSYRELNQQANQFAHFLRSIGVRPGVLVGLYGERSIELVVSLIGILKAGGAYLPLDLAYPAERVAFLLEDAEAPIIVTQQRFVKSLPTTGARIVTFDENKPAIDANPVANLGVPLTPDALAYVLYTSGSTGTPKGALVTHRNVVRLFKATEQWFRFDERDVWTLFHSHAFDFSVWELWGALLYGGRLVIVPYIISRSPQQFYDLLCDQKVSVLNQTPSAFLLLSRHEVNDSSDKLSLRFVIFGGEALNLQSLKPWFDLHGDENPRLINMYGITETTVHVTYRPLRQSDLYTTPGSVIGEPIPDLYTHVFDEDMNPLPLGVPGELYVGGAGVCQGYLKRAELSAERFIDDPWAEGDGQRLYKTGDLVRMLSNNDMQYLGRIDHQVKIRGFRIELREVEAALSQHSEIEEAVVVARSNNSTTPRQTGQRVEQHGSRLYAYCVPRNYEHGPTSSALREFLNAKLPEYMIPAIFIFLKELPLTAHGKIDRKALPAPNESRPDLEVNFTVPKTTFEQSIASIYRKVLSIEKIGIYDNFFELGGDSLRVTEVVNHIRTELKLDIEVVHLFQFPTISTLTEFLNPDTEQDTILGSIEERASKQKRALSRRKKSKLEKRRL